MIKKHEDSGSEGSIPSSTTDVVCDLGQVTYLLVARVILPPVQGLRGEALCLFYAEIAGAKLTPGAG